MNGDKCHVKCVRGYKLQIVQTFIDDPRNPRPPHSLSNSEQLELYHELETVGLIDITDPVSYMPIDRRIRIIDELLASPLNPMPQAVTSTMTVEDKLCMFDELVERDAIRLGPTPQHTMPVGD